MATRSVISISDDEVQPTMSSTKPDDVISISSSSDEYHSFSSWVSSGLSNADTGARGTKVTTSRSVKATSSRPSKAMASRPNKATSSTQETRDARVVLPLCTADFEGMSARVKAAMDEAAEAKKIAATAQEETTRAKQDTTMAQIALLRVQDELMQARQLLQPIEHTLEQIEDDLECQVCIQRIRNPVK
ncbi:hypothetical protein PUNSTDRAFT_135654 [Punctularia strigosozonata HHB-11173 SS5]|uniref:uncharacterized protein n=1 Tax=Punctularia strigosozonata (strain HHB-11173) TaxID=741275 RepID=UPI00044164F8|nr:uncharacterized protein PUNSTDRAFT_135654 [Punctularia strigosozonata HHB-11173 SS5]EIN06954.1 hypothetical protein PUNSTDRAFT_135654 [Punctularia strigosozonata HHB-11173 SS5]